MPGAPSRDMSNDPDLCWYHGNLTREEAEYLLRTDNPFNGCFLIRDSSSTSKDFVLSVYCDGGVSHYQIRRHGEDAFFSLEETTVFHGLETLIEFYQNNTNQLICTLGHPVEKDPPPPDTRRHGRTNLLHRATKMGNLKIVTELLTCGYRSIEAKDEHGQTAVHLACQLDDESILNKLIENGANVNCRDQLGNTPLHYACQQNRYDIVNVLLSNGGANFQIRNTVTDWVPLHEAACRGHKEIVKLLLSVGAPSRPRTKFNETPQKLAENNGFYQVAEILKTHEPPPPRTTKDDWYHGTLKRDEALQLMRKCEGNTDGRFLIRYSDNEKCDVLTVMFNNKPYHFPILKEGCFYVIDNSPCLDSLEHLVDHYSMMPDGLPVALQIPIKPKPKPPVPPVSVNMTRTLPSKYRKGPRHSDGNASTLPHPKPRMPRRSVDNLLGPLTIAGSTRSLTRSNMTLHLSLPPEAETQVFIPKENLIFKEVLGKGEFGAVYKAVYQSHNGSEIDVAVKTLHKDQMSTSNENDFIQEAKHMMKLDHHCIVKLIGLSQTGDDEKSGALLMVLELVPLGSLLTYLLNNKTKISPSYELLVWASQIACGMEYLENKFVHRDLAARNILLATREQAKIGDFGLSRTVDDREYYKATKGGRWPIKWYAPESFEYGTFSSASDVWSFGVTLWEMYSYGEQPYGAMRGAEVIDLIKRGERLQKPLDCDPKIYQVMEKCWEYQSRDRPTFCQLKEFFASLNPYENVRELIKKTDMS